MKLASSVLQSVALLLGITIVTPTIAANVGLDVSTKSQDVDVSTDYRIHVDYLEDRNVTFTIIAKTTGFVGFGLSANGDMSGADIVIGGVGPDGKPYFQDYHATGNSKPIVDKEQDYHLLYARENNSHTEISFTRILETCDPEDLPFTINTQKLIWSMGATDDIVYHDQNRGTRSANLLDPIEEVDLSKFKYWDMRLEQTIPASDTTYWCTFFRTPDNFTEPHHVVGFNIILPDALAVQHTHHIDVYECDAAPGLTPEQTFEPWVQNKTGAACYETHPNASFPVRYCTRVQYGWAIGGQLTMFPEHAGFPFYPNKYYMTEIHYDNPKSLGNLTFESGMRLYYTNETRDNDAAYLLIGSPVGYTQMLPPNSVDFTHIVQCSPHCTAHFPKDGLNVFAFLLHAHTSGKSLKARLWRNGVELPWLIFDANYDFNYQQNRMLREEFKVFPGDHITAECVYDTTWKDGETTLGGRSTRDEMCQVYFYYYPKMPNFTECRSEYPEKKLFEFLGIEQVELPDGELDPFVRKPDKFNGMRLSTVVAQNISWTPDARAEYQRLHRFTQHEGQCYPGDTNLYPTSYPNVPDYVPPNECRRTGGDKGRAASNFAFGIVIVLFMSFIHLLL